MLKKEKVILLGDGAVGKTSLIRKFVHDEFDDKYIASIGTKVTKKIVRVRGNELVLLIWDILGQQGYTKTHTTSFKGATGALVVMDITRIDTLINLERYWLPLLHETAGNIPVILLANKADLEPDPKLARLDLMQVAQQKDTPILLTSAKTGLNVAAAFQRIGEEMLLCWEKAMAPEGPLRAGRRISTVLEATDHILDDFCKTFRDTNYAMHLVREQFYLAGVDIRAPTKDGLLKVVDLLWAKEITFLGREKADEMRNKRLEILKDLA